MKMCEVQRNHLFCTFSEMIAQPIMPYNDKNKIKTYNAVLIWCVL